MEFAILGPLEVREDGRILELGGLKQRALLALLLLEANKVVSSERLIDALWEEAPPETAQKALQVHVSQLRKVLGKERVQTKSPGYLLRLDGLDELDTIRFGRLADEGKPDQALALCRGRPLQEFASQRFAQAEIARLEELRLACVEERIERGLAEGRHSELLGDLEALVAEEPLREAPRAQLMLALYRAGRQAEALEAYQKARAALVEELGIEPGRRLRELHQAILNQDPVLELLSEEQPASEDKGPADVAETTADLREVRKKITAISVAVTCSASRTAVVDPEAVRHIFARSLGLVEGAIQRYGGTVETVAGELVTAVFGLPAVHEDDALRAARAAEDLRDRLSALAAELGTHRGVELAFAVGISSGEIVSGGEQASLPRATGEPLTASARLAQAAEPRSILADEPTRRLLRDAVVAEPVGDVWRLVEVIGVPLPGRLMSPMVGRERERRRMQDAFDQAVGDRSCQLFTILGPAGVGKSRLVAEVLGDLADRALVARGRCLPYGDGITFWPLLEAVKEAVGIDDLDSADAVRERLVTALAGDSEAEPAAQQVAELTGLAEAEGGATDGFAAVRMLFEALARKRPLVLVFDDIHWGEKTFLDLVEYVADTSRGASILLVCLARPELLEASPAWGGGKFNATSVLLEPLSEEECARLVENLAGELAEDARGRIASAAEGNPLFVEEMLSMLIEDGLLVREAGRWTPIRDLVEVPVPPTIHALLAARLDRLEPDERTAIECAAVEGKVFHEGAVLDLSPPSVRPFVSSHLDALVRKELIRPHRSDFAGERAFRFRHLMIRDAAYDSLPKARRAELHELFGRWLDRRTGSRASGYEEILGYHLEQAYRYRAELGAVDGEAQTLAREAAERLGAAGSRAFVRRDANAAVNLMSRAAALLPADDLARVDLVPNVRVVQGLSADMSWAERVLAEAVAAARAANDRRVEGHAQVQLGFLRLFTQPAVSAHELHTVADDAIAGFEALGDELGLARAWRLRAQAHYLARRAGACAEASEHALAHARRAGDRLEVREVVEWLCVALMLGPAPAAKAAARCRELLEEVRGDPILDPTVLSVLGNMEAMQGHLDEANELLDRWRRRVEEFGEPIWLFPLNFGFIMLADDAGAAERELRAGYEALRRLGEKSHFSSMSALLARAVCAQGRYEEAEQLTRESEEAARPNDIHSHILWRTTRARVLAEKGELEAAEALAREAVGFAAESDFLDSHGDALMNLADVLALAGRAEDAGAAIQEALRLYEQKGDLPAIERARARLTAYV